MSKQKLDNLGVSAFCESMAMMARSGIQTDEAISLLQSGRTHTGGVLEAGLAVMKEQVDCGSGLALAMEKSGIFPEYALQMVSAGEQSSSKYMSILLGAVVYTDIAMNTVVLKCHIGTAQAACAAVDSIGLTDVAGTLAGDDTIFVLCYSAEAAARIKAELDGLFGF